MSLKSLARTAAALMLAAFALGAAAQQPPLPYGSPISLDDAKKVADAAAAEARKINVPEAVAIVDPAGQLVYFERMDNTQTGGVNVALGKARSAALFRRPTKVFGDLLAKGSNFTYLLGLEGAVPVPGGIPIVIGGKIVGGIGTSGGSGEQDVQVSEAGVAALR
ncbi:MAG: heme-binding protein [Burkholderiales bacterium]|nr:heme-binding protein [Burkholderiales bacterium]